jgi:xylulokinase
MCLGSNDIAVSLGTSDTLFLSMQKLPEEGFTEGHILANPISSETEFMALLCFKNGSLTRERIRKEAAEGSWNIFNQLLDSTTRGNFGNIGFYFDLQEIIPKVRGKDKFTVSAWCTNF